MSRRTVLSRAHAAARLLLLPLLLAGARTGSAQTADGPADNTALLQEAMEQVRTDLEHDTQTLQQFREKQSAERLARAERLRGLQTRIAADRLEIERLQQAREREVLEDAALEAEMRILEEELLQVRAHCIEYGRAAETRAGAAEGTRLAAALTPLRLRLHGAAPQDPALAVAVESLLEGAAAWNARRLGGERFEGVALDPDGFEHRGQFAVLGPLAFFAADASENDAPTGLAVTSFGATLPEIRPATADPEQVRRLLAGEAAELPVDASGGDALRLRDARTGGLEHLRKGGLVMIPLLAIGGLALVLSLWKLRALAQVHTGPDSAAFKALDLAREGRPAEAQQTAYALPQPLSALVIEAVLHHDSPRETIEEILHEQILGRLPDLERHLGTLSVLGGVAPLLGLLGTVTGMIHTFQLVTVFGSGNAGLLSGGISEALVTTETGLVIAIPVLLAHAFLARRAHDLLGRLEQTAVTLVNHLAAGSRAP